MKSFEVTIAGSGKTLTVEEGETVLAAALLALVVDGLLGLLERRDLEIALAERELAVRHGDLDHAGGLRSLVRRFPDADIRLNAAKTVIRPCIADWSWSWGATEFRALHPSPGLPYLGND